MSQVPGRYQVYDKLRVLLLIRPSLQKVEISGPDIELSLT